MEIKWTSRFREQKSQNFPPKLPDEMSKYISSSNSKTKKKVYYQQTKQVKRNKQTSKFKN